MPNIPQLQSRRYRVTDNKPLASGVFGLWLEPVDPVDVIPPFQAGQWVYLQLLNPDGSVWARAAYSFANAPSGAGSTIELGIKVEKDFTQRAQTLVVGDEVEIQGPWGVFTLKKDKSRIALLAGGIGVTPLLSMLREACAMDTVPSITFFYSFRTPEEAAYLDDLKALAATHPEIKLIPVCTRGTDAWTGVSGRIGVDTLATYLPDGADDYVVCGPDPFMDGIRDVLVSRGVEPKMIRKESFG